ncbi:hypothetical protein DFP77_1021 [Marinomonas foliarum]|uniref:Uncharacterized protein n=1 Tax=Marinomonas foliarum TaxID=491950 RepID=A0A369AJ46_9GAMM|nr:hypothetical protein DFP77_1021 [Marinomonas foliarum]
MSFGLEVMVRSALSHIGDLIAVSLTCPTILLFSFIIPRRLIYLYFYKKLGSTLQASNNELKLTL